MPSLAEVNWICLYCFALFSSQFCISFLFPNEVWLFVSMLQCCSLLFFRIHFHFTCYLHPVWSSCPARLWNVCISAYFMFLESSFFFMNSVVGFIDLTILSSLIRLENIKKEWKSHYGQNSPTYQVYSKLLFHKVLSSNFFQDFLVFGFLFVYFGNKNIIA